MSDCKKQNGVNGSAGGTITIQPASITGNIGFGWVFSGNPTITLHGVFSFDNAGGDQALVHGILIVYRS